MTRSLFNPWSARRQHALYERLRLLSPERAWSIMWDLREAEIHSFQQAEWEEFRRIGEVNMAVAPMVTDREDVGRAATRFATWNLTRNLHVSFLLAFASAIAEGRYGDLVDISSVDTLTGHLAAGTQAIVVPLHVGALEAGVGALATLFPMTMVVSAHSRVSVDPSYRVWETLPAVDMEILRPPNPMMLTTLSARLREGRLVVAPSNYFVGTTRSLVTLEFGGQEVAVADSIALLAQRVGAVLVPVAFVREAEEIRYTLKTWPAIPVRPGVAGRVDALRSLFAILESVLLEHDAAEWEGWFRYQEMVEIARGQAGTP